MTQQRLLISVFALICVFASNTTSAATASIDFLSDDISFQAYDALNLLSSAEDLSDPVWELVNASGMASKAGKSLTLETYPDNIFQSVDLIANETYFLTFTGAGFDGDIAWIRVRESLSGSTVVYEYLSLRGEVDSYPLQFTANSTGTYSIELKALPGYDNIAIDWGMMGLFRESDLLATGANWSTFSVWADSMGAPENRGGWPRQLKALLDTPDYVNGAVGGETSTEILNRMLLASEFGQLAFIWAGNNNANDVDIVLADIAQMVSILPHENFLVISIHNNANHDISSPTYADVIEINTRLEQTYGRRFVDTRSFLIANADMTDADDLADASAGIVPRSFRVGDIHLNTKGQKYVTDILTVRIASLNSVPLPTVSNSNGDSGGASSGGGCTISSSTSVDPIWLFLVFTSFIGYVRCHVVCNIARK